MRNGIIVTLVFFVLVQLTGILLFVFIEDKISPSLSIEDFIKQLDNPPTFFEKYHDVIMISIASIIFFLVFIGLGFYINNKNQKAVNYWKFLIIGIVTSNISVSIFYFGAIYKELFDMYDFSFHLDEYVRKISKHLYVIPLYASFMIVICAISAIFHKRYKTKRKLFNDLVNDSLDSEI